MPIYESTCEGIRIVTYTLQEIQGPMESAAGAAAGTPPAWARALACEPPFDLLGLPRSAPRSEADALPSLAALAAWGRCGAPVDDCPAPSLAARVSMEFRANMIRFFQPAEVPGADKPQFLNPG